MSVPSEPGASAPSDERAVPSPLATLRIEVEAQRRKAAERAEGERRYAETEAKLADLRGRWAGAFDHFFQIDDDARRASWAFEEKQAECVRRLLRIGEFVRERDEFAEQWRRSKSHAETYSEPLWADRLRKVAEQAVGENPLLEMRYAAALLVLASDGNRAELETEIRQLVEARELVAVTAWFSWWRDKIICPAWATHGPGELIPYALPPDAGDESPANQLVDSATFALMPDGPFRRQAVLSATSSRSGGEVQQAFLGGPDFRLGQPGT